MQYHQVAHRDIKTDNIYQSQEGAFKLIDFGISKIHNPGVQHQHTKNVVTRCYRPPEIFFGERNYNGQAVDMWSVGCVFAEVITGAILFPGQSDIEQLGLIFDTMGTPDIDDWIEVESLPCYLPFAAQKAKDLRAVLAARKLDRRGNGDINPEFINLVVRMLQLNPSKRISAQEALVQLDKIQC